MFLGSTHVLPLTLVYCAIDGSKGFRTGKLQPLSWADVFEYFLMEERK